MDDRLEEILREFQHESFSQVYVNYGGPDLEFQHTVLPRIDATSDQPENASSSSNFDPNQPGPSNSQNTPTSSSNFDPNQPGPSNSQNTAISSSNFDPNQPGPSNSQGNVNYYFQHQPDEVLEPPPPKKFSISTITPCANQEQYSSELDFLTHQMNSGSENMVFRRRNYLAPGASAPQKCLENSMQFADVDLAGGCRTAPLPPDNLTWPFYLTGAPGTPYENGKFFGKVNFSRDSMDTSPPHVKFDTIFFHPDCCKRGNLDMRELAKDWNSEKSIVDVFAFIWHKMRNGATISETRSLQDYYQPDLAAHAKEEPRRFLIFISYVTKHTNC